MEQTQERVIQAATDHRFTDSYLQMLRTFCADRTNL